MEPTIRKMRKNASFEYSNADFCYTKRCFIRAHEPHFFCKRTTLMDACAYNVQKCWHYCHATNLPIFFKWKALDLVSTKMFSPRELLINYDILAYQNEICVVITRLGYCLNIFLSWPFCTVHVIWVWIWDNMCGSDPCTFLFSHNSCRIISDYYKLTKYIQSLPNLILLTRNPIIFEILRDIRTWHITRCRYLPHFFYYWWSCFIVHFFDRKYLYEKTFFHFLCDFVAVFPLHFCSTSWFFKLDKTK